MTRLVHKFFGGKKVRKESTCQITARQFVLIIFTNDKVRRAHVATTAREGNHVVVTIAVVVAVARANGTVIDAENHDNGRSLVTVT
ncbi:hypothetical protein POVWA2_061300 [Plasmodium ovale wallikeri]|uniref:Uncharacterized protein n=1 Tax=Plasmodium ovale wallikeri TaxID=864142 RepID=A0A1A9A2H5_PLAOA|nr:hypothetical protein POVWA1_061740 [Plasmodium ovale wallikeri]SBT50939.1 hypothetical protein POVWA2_061300 [Plasmodium ovale wallikeri]